MSSAVEVKTLSLDNPRAKIFWNYTNYNGTGEVLISASYIPLNKTYKKNKWRKNK